MILEQGLYVKSTMQSFQSHPWKVWVVGLDHEEDSESRAIATLAQVCAQNLCNFTTCEIADSFWIF